MVAPSGVDPEEVLTNAQSEFINGNNDKAIKLALSVANVSTLANRAWRIIGAAACRNKDLKLAGDAYRRLDPAARQYLIYTCQREAVSYTHLDVYKRQVRDGEGSVPGGPG